MHLISNSQLPTPKESRPQRLGETRTKRLIGACSAPMLRATRLGSWELAVGSCALSLLRKLLVDPVQLVLVAKVDLETAALALADDADAGAQCEAEPLFGGTRVHVFLLFGLFRRRRDRALHQDFGLADR